jgi:hypothetical protein
MKFKNAIFLTILSVMFISSRGFSQKPDLTDDGLSEKKDMTLLKDGSEKEHIKNKRSKKNKDVPGVKSSPSKDSTETSPPTKGLPTDVD